MTSTIKTTAPAFFSLPIEMRQMIYEFVFDTNDFDIKLEYNQDYIHYPVPVTADCTRFIGSLARRTYLLCASRQIMHEAFKFCSILVVYKVLRLSRA